jgi:hypothetical protein
VKSASFEQLRNPKFAETANRCEIGEFRAAVKEFVRGIANCLVKHTQTHKTKQTQTHKTKKPNQGIRMRTSNADTTTSPSAMPVGLHNLPEDAVTLALRQLTREEGLFFLSTACKRLRTVVATFDGAGEMAAWQPRTPVFELQKTLRRVRALARKTQPPALIARDLQSRLERLAVALLQLRADGVVVYDMLETSSSLDDPICVLGLRRLQVLRPHEWVAACEGLARECGLADEYEGIVLRKYARDYHHLHKYGIETEEWTAAGPTPSWVVTAALWHHVHDLLKVMGLQLSEGFPALTVLDLSFTGVRNPLLHQRWTYWRDHAE